VFKRLFFLKYHDSYFLKYLVLLRGKVVVEKKLAREQNLSRHDLGREAFVSKVRITTYQS
jgi:hypothetical protein